MESSTFTKQLIPDGYGGTIDYLMPSRYCAPFTLMGMGSSGSVCSATDSSTGHRVAIKRFPWPFSQIDSAKQLYREIKIVGGLTHRNVIGMTGVYRGEGPEVYVVYENMDSDLSKMISSLSKDVIPQLLSQLLQGVYYLHSNGIVHRDLKPANILVNLEGDDLTLKIGDFGYARIVDAWMTPRIGTMDHMAPEILKDDRKYTTAVDMWAVGCIFGYMLIKESVFSSSTSSHADQRSRVLAELSEIFSMKFAEVDQDALDLLKSLLHENPETRISAMEALSHPYLGGGNPIPAAVAQLDYDESSLRGYDKSDIQKKIEDLCSL